MILHRTVLLSLLLAAGCSDDNTPANSGTEGSTATGGSSAGGTTGASTGGTSSTGATSSTGGKSSTGGSMATGGAMPDRDAGPDGGDMMDGGDAGDAADGAASQTPPTKGADVMAWLATGAYKKWTCESAVHAARSPSPHGFNRICSNDVISQHVSGTADWPVGAAAVKELYAKMSDTEPSGYSVYLKTKADSAGGANWYWYEILPGSSSAIADGFGDTGTAKSICVGCHVAAGSDAAHTPSVGGRDEVYTPVAK